MTRKAGAQFVRLTVRWNAIAPSTPPVGFVATDPTSPGYQLEWARPGGRSGRSRRT